MTTASGGQGAGSERQLELGEAQRQALLDLTRAYEAHYERVELETREWVRNHSALGQLFPDFAASARQEQVEAARARLLSAIAGDWTSLGKHLSERGAALAGVGCPLRSACEWARAFRDRLLSHVVERCASDSMRLRHAVQALNDLADQCVTVTADAYLAQIDASVRAREDDLATTLDSIGDAVIVTDAAGRVTRMNPVAEHLTGFGLAVSAGRPLSEVFRIEHEHSGETVESPVGRVLREGVIVGLANHTVLVGKDGVRRPIADSGAPVRRENGEIRGVVLVFRDVTEERQAEQELRHWERIFHHATWGVGVVTAKDLTFQSVNLAYAQMHGYTVEELIGEPVSKLWAPDTREDMERHAHETRTHGRLIVETTHQRKDGSRFPVEVVGTVVKDGRGVPVYFIANVQDISERRQFQQSQIRAIELEAENRRIEEANRLKSEFLANMSHELRTPLNSIIGFTELLHDEQVGAILAKQKEFLNEILTGGRHLLRLINDVLDLAKVEAGKMDFLPEPVDLSSLVHTVVQSLSATATIKGLALEVTVDGTVGNVSLDPGRFAQLLYNYVSNALKFTPDRGRVAVRVLAEGSAHFRLEVEDSGPGIAPEDASRLFVPFQQLDSGATKRHGGTGLGLALTKRLAEAQGGSVGLRPAEGGGSIFFAVLPRRPLGPSPRADVPAATTVLIVENERNEQQLLARILSGAGYQVTSVATAAEGSAAWKKRPYDAILLSVTVPDGRDLKSWLLSIRQDTGRASVPVIAMTVIADGNAAAGFAVTDVLTKPIEAQALLAALDHGGAPPARGTPVLIVDDDASSLKLMEATLAQLGYEALCFSNAADALHALERVRPAAIVLDLLMPGTDGFTFLEQVRSVPANRTIPIMIWTVKDLSPEERRSLHDTAQAVVQKGAGDDSPLHAVLRAFLPLRAAGSGPGTSHHFG
jgi:PAS domain S-box-containing protein